MMMLGILVGGTGPVLKLPKPRCGPVAPAVGHRRWLHIIFILTRVKARCDTGHWAVAEKLRA